jgi:hypothetical protein
MIKSFRSLRKNFDCYSSWMQHLTKDILTTEITNATKESDILIINFVLFVRFVVNLLFGLALLHQVQAGIAARSERALCSGVTVLM